MDKKDLYIQIGFLIREARQSHKPTVSQHTLSKKIGLSRTSLVNIEKGKHHIQLHTLYQIATSLETNLNDLLPKNDGLKPIKITSSTELGSKATKTLEKIISKYDKKEVKLVE